MATSDAPKAVIVRNIAPRASEDEIKTFFTFCGEIEEFQLSSQPDESGTRVAMVAFTSCDAASAAAVLSGAVIAKQPIEIALYHGRVTAGVVDEMTERPRVAPPEPSSYQASAPGASSSYQSGALSSEGEEMPYNGPSASFGANWRAEASRSFQRFNERHRLGDKMRVLDNKLRLSSATNRTVDTVRAVSARAMENDTIASGWSALVSGIGSVSGRLSQAVWSTSSAIAGTVAAATGNRVSTGDGLDAEGSPSPRAASATSYDSFSIADVPPGQARPQ